MKQLPDSYERELYEENQRLHTRQKRFDEMFEILYAMRQWWKQGNAPIHPHTQLFSSEGISDDIEQLIGKIEKQS